MNEAIVEFINVIILYATDYLMPFLLVTFAMAVVVRMLISFVINRQRNFVREFCKRVHHDMLVNPHSKGSFYNLMKRFLARTYFESFELRAKYMRRSEDRIMTIGDRVFLIQDGVIRLINDFLKHIKYLHKDSRHQPNFNEIANNAFASNPVFNRVMGLFSLTRANELLNILPGIFIVAGIFGTFLGIMRALPELTNMDITNAEVSKLVIDNFLINISFALTSSILGIILSIIMSFLNTLLSPERTYVEIIDAFKSTAEILWNKCEDNELDNHPEFQSTRESESEDAFELAIASIYAKTIPPVQGDNQSSRPSA